MRHLKIIRESFHFDELNAADIPEGRRGPIAKWLLDNPEQWRVHDSGVDLKVKNQYAIVIKGEEGSGKTTELRIQEDRLRRVPDALPILLDMTSYDPSVDDSIWAFLRRSIEGSLARSEMFMEYRAALRRLQISQPFRSFYDVQDSVRGDCSRYSDDDLLTSKQIILACQIYENSRQTASDRLAFIASQNLSRRAYVMLDNADLLGRGKVGEIARGISRAAEADTYIIVTTRPENYMAWAAGLNERRKVKPVILRASGERLFKIADRRLCAAENYARSESPAIVHELTITSRRVRALIDEIKGDPGACRLVADWHNRSVRQVLPSLLETLREAAVRHPEESIYGVIFRTLVREAMPESMEALYTPEWPKTDHKESFVFLRLRILSYLNKRGEENAPTLKEMQDDFRDAFGIEGNEIRQAVLGLAFPNWSVASTREASTPAQPSGPGVDTDMDDEMSPDDPRGALLRLEPTRAGELDLVDHRVVILSAGALMTSRVVKSCDFLSWIYERSHWVRPVRRHGIPESQIKLNKAVEVVDRHIIPLFLAEHQPYMAEGISAYQDGVPQKTRRRLDQYRRLFGYETGHWFIGDLARSLKDYADDRPDRVKDTAKLERLLEDVERYISNLDAVRNSTPVPHPPLPR